MSKAGQVLLPRSKNRGLWRRGCGKRSFGGDSYGRVCNGAMCSRRYRLPCRYYRVSLHGEDLGDWSELGVLAVLSGLQQESYRGRLRLRRSL
ncbi:hypothetical protein [Nostoc sp. DedQUE09]|uniref:hypothetical protein n=1 Tax=Nostoc sp. DedQUE09 TaxID=3075394 RepID=UPI002AD58D16|nr:hypothetical protein [Nostoc sp. DedQUE09]MDZ7950723.1 hypothetical protein [Nostoc sp. DedQUE09]